MDSSLFLIKEYETLHNESKRKFPTIAKESKDTINELKEKGQKKATTHEQEDMCGILLMPIESVFEHKAQRLYGIALSTLGKLCMTPYLTKKGAVMTIKVLNNISNQELRDEMMQINVLQIVMVCLSPTRFTMSQEFVNNVLDTLLRLYESKERSVVCTAKAALNQLFSHIINALVKTDDDVKDKDDDLDPDEEIKGTVTMKMSQLNRSTQSGPALKIASNLLSGLVSHLNPDKETEWPVPVSNSTTALALDLLALIVEEGKEKLAEFKQIMIILDEVFDPLLNQMTSMKSNFGISIRLINCITLFTIYIEWGLEPLTRWWLTFINIKTNAWQKQIAFEAFSFIFNSKTLVKSLAESNEQCCLANILKVFEQYLSSINEALSDDVYGHRHPYYQSQKLSKYLEDKNFDTVIPPPDTAVLVKLLIECLYNVSNRFMNLEEELESEEFKQNIFNSQHTSTFLNVLSYCLYLCSDEINIQTVLNTYQNLFYLAGKLDNSKIRSTIINSLGKFATPNSYEKLSQKNVLVIKKIINISHWLSKYLDSKCWYYTFKIMQKIEPLVREELGLKPVEEEYLHRLVHESVRREIETAQADKVNQTHDESNNYKALSNTVPRRKLSHSEEEEKDYHNMASTMSNKSVQPVRPSRSKRRTGTGKQKEGNRDWSPIGRSRTITNYQKTQEEHWHEDFIHSDLYKIDLDQIHSSISTLFLTTLKFTDDLIKSMITGLGELIVNSVEELSTQPTFATGRNSLAANMVPKPKKNLFALRKMTEIALVNIYRVDKFWQIIIDQLMVISVCNNEDFRSLALEAFMIIITEILLKKEPKSASHPTQVTSKMAQGLSKVSPKKNIESSDSVYLGNKANISNLSADLDEKVTPTGRSIHKRIRLDSDLVERSDDEEEIQPINNSEMPNEETIDWEDERWQIKVLKPFLDSIISTTYEKEQVHIVNHVKNIVEHCYPKINDEGWKVILTSICNINYARIQDKVFVLIYELIETIATDYAQYIGFANLKILITCLKRYATHHQGTLEYNKSEAHLECCCKSSRIFVRLARHLENYNEENDLSKTYFDEKQPSIEEIWRTLFNEIKHLFTEVQYSTVIRKSTLEALKEIITTSTSKLNCELWEYTLDNTLLGMYEKSVSRYIDQLVGFSTTKAREVKQREIASALQTPTFSFGGGGQTNTKKATKKGQGRKMKFDEESIQKFHQRNQEDSSHNGEYTGFGMPPEETPKTNKPSQASIEDQNICIIIMNIFNSALQNYNHMFVVNKYKTGRSVLDLWVLYVKIMSPLISNATAEILKSVLKTIDFILNSPLVEYFYTKYDSVTLNLFEEINSVIQRKTDLVLTVEATELLIKIFKQIFTKQNIEEKPQLLNPQNLNVTLHILRINLINARPTMGLNVMRQQNDLKEDEKLIFDFIEQLGVLLHNNDDALKYYLSFLLNFISYDPNAPHFEMFVRRTFVVISEDIIKDNYSLPILYELIPELYAKTWDIVDLRYQNNACMSLVFSMKSSASLFETAGMFLLQVTSHILDKDVEEDSTNATESSQEGMKKPNLQIEISDDEDEGDREQNDSAADIGNIDEKDSDEEIHARNESITLKKGGAKDTQHRAKMSLMSIEEEDSILMSPARLKPQNVTMHSVQEMILGKIMDILKDTLLFDISRIEKHNKAVKDDVIKSSQDLDVQVINFIINSLLPHAHKLGKKFEHTLVSIIDKGCNGYLDAISTSGLNMFGSSSTVLAKSNSLSTYCFDNLFELCSYKQLRKGNASMNENKREKLEEIRRKIAKTTTPILLERCKETLKKFLYDEMKSGTIMMSQQRAEEVVFIIEKLRKLEVYPNLLNEIVEDKLPPNAGKIQEEAFEKQSEARNECLKSTKGHLFLLVPLFAEFITSKEEMVKESLKDVFVEIALANGIHSKLNLTSGIGAGGELSLL